MELPLRRIIAAAMIFLSLANCGGVAHAGYSAEFCINRPGFYRYFEVKQLARDRMKFGVSIWARNVITVYGTAHRRRAYWLYLHLNPKDPAENCKVTFSIDKARRVARVWGDKSVACTAEGGVGMEVGRLYFPRWSYRGRITHQLDSEGSFFQPGGRC